VTTSREVVGSDCGRHGEHPGASMNVAEMPIGRHASRRRSPGAAARSPLHRLMEQYQQFDPFKFLIYAESPAPRSARPSVRRAHAGARRGISWDGPAGLGWTSWAGMDQLRSGGAGGLGWSSWAEVEQLGWDRQLGRVRSVR